MAIKISQLWLSQRNIDRLKVSRLLSELREGGGFRSRLVLREAEDGEYEIIDGHHRATALWLSGRQTLTFGEYTLVYSQRSQKRFGRVGDSDASQGC